MKDSTQHRANDARFFTVLLWLCAAAAVWLLFSPSAFDRRALTRRTELVEAEIIRERLYNADLQRWRDALENDPSAIEREARRLGYGRPNEHAYNLSPVELARARAELAEAHEIHRPALDRFRKSVAPALMVLIAGAVAVLFFSGLKIEDPLDRPASPGPNGKSDD